MNTYEQRTTAAFPVENMHKDIGCFQQTIGPTGLLLPGADAAAAVYAHTVERGHGGQDFSIIINTVDELSRA